MSELKHNPFRDLPALIAKQVESNERAEKNMVPKNKSNPPSAVEMRKETTRVMSEGDRKLKELQRRGEAAGLPRSFFTKIAKERFTSTGTETPTRSKDLVNGTQTRTADLSNIPIREMKPGMRSVKELIGSTPAGPGDTETDEFQELTHEVSRLEGWPLAKAQQAVARSMNSQPGQGASKQPATELAAIARARASLRDRDGK